MPINQAFGLPGDESSLLSTRLFTSVKLSNLPDIEFDDCMALKKPSPALYLDQVVIDEYESCRQWLWPAIKELYTRLFEEKDIDADSINFQMVKLNRWLSAMSLTVYKQKNDTKAGFDGNLAMENASDYIDKVDKPIQRIYIGIQDIGYKAVYFLFDLPIAQKAFEYLYLVQSRLSEIEERLGKKTANEIGFYLGLTLLRAIDAHRSNALMFGTNEQRKELDRKLIEALNFAQEMADSEEKKLAVLFYKYQSHLYSSSNISEAESNVLTPVALLTQIEQTTKSKAFRSIHLWSKIKQAELVSFDIGTRDDVHYKKWLSLLDDLEEDLSQVEDGLIWMDSLLSRYQTLKNLGFYDEAITYIEKIVKRLPEFQEGVPELAKSYLWSGRIFTALQSASEGLTKQKRYDDALVLLKQQWETWKDNQSGLNLAAAYLSNGNYSEAIKIGNEIDYDQLFGLSQIWRFNQSLAYFKLGDLGNAQQALMRGLSVEKLDETEMTFYIALLALNGEMDKALMVAGKVASKSIGARQASAMKSYIAISSFDASDVNVKLGLVNEPLPKFAFETIWFESEMFNNGYPYIAKQSTSTDSSVIDPVLVVSSGVTSLHSSTSDKSLLATANNSLVTIWNMVKGLPVRKLVVADNVKSLEFFDNDRYLLVISGDAIEAFNTASGELKYSIGRDINEWFTPVISKGLGKLISAVNKGNASGIGISNLNNPSETKTIEIKEQVASIALDSSGTRLFVAVNKVPDNDNWISSIYVVDLLTRKVLDEMTDIRGIVRSISLTDSDEKLVLGKQLDTNMFSETVQTEIDNDWKRFKKPTVKTENTSAITQTNLKTIDQLRSLNVTPEEAYFDEEQQRLIYQANISNLHTWNTEVGSEISVDDQFYESIHFQNGAVIGIKEDMREYGLGTVSLKPISGELKGPDKLTVPMVKGVVGYLRNLKYFNGGASMYAQIHDGYSDSDRVLLRFDEQGKGAIFPFTLKGEEIYSLVDEIGFVSEKDRTIRLRDIETGELITSFELKENWPSFKWIEIDKHGKTIWVATYDNLYAYSFSGELKHTYEHLIGDFTAAALPQNGSHLLAVYQVGNSTLLAKIDRLDGKVVNTKILEDRLVSRVQLSSLQNYLSMTRSDGGVELWDLNHNEELATLFSLPEDGWLVIDADGRYDSNRPGNIQSVAWRINDAPLEPFSVAVFMKQFYEPRLLPRKMNQADFPEVVDLDKINIIQPKLSFEMVEPNKVNADHLDITLKVSKGDLIDKPSSDYGVYDLRLFRDGQQISFFPQSHGQIQLNDEGEKTVVFQNVRLASGDTGKQINFSAMAFNNQGVKSDTVEMTYVLNKAHKASKKRVYLVNVGVNRYTNPAWNLEYAVNDASLLSSALKKGIESTAQYDEIINLPLTTNNTEFVSYQDIEATFKNIVLGLNGIPKIMPDDALIITWSGHGYANSNGVFHLITSNVGEGDSKEIDEAFLKNSVSTSDLSSWLETIDAKNIVLVIDACNSAASVEGKSFKPGPMGSKGFGQLAWFKGMQILTASQSDDVALESSLLKHGLLTYSLAKEGLALSAADFLPSDSEINVSEWLKFGQKRVPELYLALINGNLSKTLLDSRGVELDEPNEKVETQLPGLFDFNRSNDEMNLSVRH